ncbi:putative inorganic phosphate cotransporter [Ctenocephalides felis]|uniref:putative inorganic phosphate cotransporter n=1 Tax=Ctenocephalides felis TaxID=7515 RepID=UPI000E6E2512|nr:putative inorganic phosphate cotransporter [Ctenocephalides felis]
MNKSIHQWLMKVCPVQQHMLIVAMCFFAMLVSHGMRTVFSVSMNEMKLRNDIENYIDDDGEINCPRPPNNTMNITMESFFDWDATQRLNLGRAFYLSYLVGHITCGMLSDYFGGKQIMGYGVLISAMTTFVTPQMLHQWGYNGFVASRVFVGLFQGSINPSCATLLAHWIPRSKRCRLATIIFSAGHLGTGIGYSATNLGLGSGWTVLLFIWRLGNSLVSFLGKQ